MLGMQASGVRTAGYFGMGTSLLSGVSNATSPFLRYGSASPATGGYSTGKPAFG